MQKEIWKDIPGYEGYYQASIFGRIKRLKQSKKSVEKIIKQHLNRTGYLQITLTTNGKRKSISSHRLIALTFILNPKNKPTVNHKNGIKTDNCAENLEWMTHKENVRHAWKNGICKPHPSHLKGKTGKDCIFSKPVIQFDKDMNFIKKYSSMTEAERDCISASGHVSAVCNGKRKTAGGYIWRYL